MSDADNSAPNWYEATRIEDRLRPRLGVDTDVDVCVIGGGLAGLTVAREIARRGWSVALLEANRLAWTASGRNTGFVLPGFFEDIDNIIERVGLDHAKQLWSLSERGLDYVRDTIAQTGMPGVDPVDGWLDVSRTDNDAMVRHKVERLRWIGAGVEMWSSDRLRAQLPSRRYFNAMHYPRAFHIHPLNYALGLAAAAEAAGVRIFEETPAVAIDPAGVRKRIITPGGRVRAAHVVLAGNVHLGQLMPRLAATLMPITTYVVVSEPLGDKLGDVIRYRGAVTDGKNFGNHYRIVGGDRLQWSGRMTVWAGAPQRFARALVADMRRNFPELGRIAVASIWSGTFGRSVHRMLQIGAIEPGLWVASGFSGQGLNTTAMAGELVAQAIVDGDETWRLFAPYELVWAGGGLGRAAMQGVYWGARPLGRLRQEFARYRESARRRRAERLARRTRRIKSPVPEAGGPPPGNGQAGSHAADESREPSDAGGL